MKITFIGVGKVGSALSDSLAKAGHFVTIAARDSYSKSVMAALGRNPALKVRHMELALADAEVVFLAVPFSAAQDALKTAGDLTGKILVDCTNPITSDLNHSLENNTSGGETVQSFVPEAKVVKAFSIYGYENFEDSGYSTYRMVKPAMLIAGNDGEAKKTVATLCADLGWEAIDTGEIAQSLHLEHLALLWIKMARVQGAGPGFVWARLKRSSLRPS